MTTVTLSVTTTSRPVLGNGGGGGGAIPPSNTVAPVISGSSDIGSVLSTTDGTWSGTIPITYTYQWKRNGVSILGATASTYTLVVADYNLPITCEVTATNIAGSASATSNAITCTGVAPANTVAPVISGTPTVGQTLSSTTGTWTGNPSPTYTYQWKRGASNISGATSSTYTLVQADATFAITCVVTATNVVGSANATSNSVTVFDADAQAFITAATITDNTQKNAVNQLTVDLKAASIWTKMKAIYPFVGGTATTHKWNLKNPLDTNAAFRLVFGGGWIHSSTGAKPNAINTVADTFLIPSTSLTLNDQHLSYYTRTNVNTTEVEIGCNVGGNPPNTLLEIRTSGITYVSIAAGSYTTYTDPNSLGFYLGSRTASNSIRLFKNGTNVASGTTASTSNPTNTLVLGGLNSGALVQFRTQKECAFASIGDGLTDTDAANFYTAVQAFQTTLGRQV